MSPMYLKHLRLTDCLLDPAECKSFAGASIPDHTEDPFLKPTVPFRGTRL